MVAYPKDHVKDGPDVDEDELTRRARAAADRALRARASSRQAPQQPTETADADQAMTRSEEEIEVGTRQVEAGSARLRKWVETEPVALDVELRREVAQVTREPIDQPVGDHEFGEDEVEVPLSAGEARRRRSRRSRRSGSACRRTWRRRPQTVQDEVRKERVEVEGDVDAAS